METCEVLKLDGTFEAIDSWDSLLFLLQDSCSYMYWYN